MLPRRSLRWSTVLLLASSLVPPAALPQGHARLPRRETRFLPGSDLWFGAIFKLASPLEGGQLQFQNHHFSVTQGALIYPVPLGRAVLSFTLADTAGVSRLGGAQWISRLPLSFNGPGFAGGTDWNAAAALPGGLTLTHDGGLLVMVGSKMRRTARPPR